MPQRQRILSSFLVVAMVLVLAACGSSKKNDPTTVPATNQPTSAPDQTQASSTAPFGLTLGTPSDTTANARQGPAAVTPGTAALPTYVSDFDKNGDGWYTYDELYAAVSALIPSYAWPTAYQVTPDTVMKGFAHFKGSANASWQVPYEYTLVGSANTCAWQHEWLDAYASGDTAMQNKSLAALNDNLDHSLATDEGYLSTYRKAYQQASLGDPSGIQQRTDLDCKNVTFAGTSATP
ncbi:MAG: hypothetical protein QM589_03725 [Thermomicrobiales bacterium]